MKLEQTTSANSFRYGWLISRVFPYIRPFLGRAVLGLLVAIPVGMLDGVVAFALKPYMDYVVGQKDLVFTIWHHTFSLSWSAMAMAIPFAVVFFAMFKVF